MANPKRKSLMAALTEYQNENYYSKPGQRGMTKDGDSKADIAEARRRQAQVKAQAAKKKEEKKKNDPPKTTNTGSGSSGGTSTPTRYRQQAQVTRDNRNKTEAGGIRNTGGRGGSVRATASTPVRPKRSDFPAGRQGQARYQAALTKYNAKKNAARPHVRVTTPRQRKR